MSLCFSIARNRFVDEGTWSGCQRLDWPWNNAVYLYRGFLILGISFGIFFRLVKSEITFERRGPVRLKRRRGGEKPEVPDRSIREAGVLPFQFCSLLYFSASISVPRSSATRSSKFYEYDQFCFQSSFVSSVADWKRTIGNKNRNQAIQRNILRAKITMRKNTTRRIERVLFMREFQQDTIIIRRVYLSFHRERNDLTRKKKRKKKGINSDLERWILMMADRNVIKTLVVRWEDKWFDKC